MTLPLFDQPRTDPRYDPIREFTQDHDGLRALYLGMQDDYLVILGHPAQDRIDALVSTVATARGFWSDPDENELFPTWARVVKQCPDWKDHDDDTDDDWEDGCWTCDTQVIPRSRGRYLDWRTTARGHLVRRRVWRGGDGGKYDENATKSDYFPVVVWQINDAIGCI